MEGESNKESNNIDNPFSQLKTMNEKLLSTNTNTFKNEENYAKAKTLNIEKKVNEPIPTEEIDYFTKTNTLDTVEEKNEFGEKNTITETTYQNVDTLNNGEFTYTETIQKPDSGYLNNEGVNEEKTSGNEGLVSSSPLSKQDLKNVGSYLSKIVNFNDYSNTVSTNVDNNQNNNADLISSETGGINTNNNNNNVQPSTTGESKPIINDYSNFNYFNQKSSSASNIQYENNNQFSQQYNNIESLFPSNEFQSVDINQRTSETNTGKKMGELSLNEVNNALYENTNIKTEYPLNEYTGTDATNKNTTKQTTTTTNVTDVSTPEYKTNTLPNFNTRPSIRKVNGTTIVEYPPVQAGHPFEITGSTTSVKKQTTTTTNITDVSAPQYKTNTFTNFNNRPTIRKVNGTTIVEYPPVQVGRPFEITGNSNENTKVSTVDKVTPLTDDNSLTKLGNELFNANTSDQFELPNTNTFSKEVQSTQNFEQQISVFDASKENTEVYMPENQVKSTITTDVFSYDSKENKNIDLSKEDLTQIPNMQKTNQLKTEVRDSKILKTSSVVDNPLPTITRNPIIVNEKKQNPIINMPLKTQPTIIKNLGTSYVEDTQNKGLAKSYTTYSNPTQTLFRSQAKTSNSITNSNNNSKVNESQVQDEKVKKSKTVVNNTTQTKSQK